MIFTRQKVTTVSFILAFIVPVIIYVTYTASKRDQNKLMRQRVEWVQKCLKDFESINLGMTRGEIQKNFRMDGGIQAVSRVRFIHPSCPYFKIDVEFACKRNPEDQNRSIWGEEDKAIKVSKPYIERPFID